MKKIIVSILAVLFFCGIVVADDITLTSPEALTQPTASKITEWEVTKINAAQKVMKIKYRWRDGSNVVIEGLPNSGRNGWLEWTCADVEVPGTNAECTGVGDPNVCCTGAGTGTCDDMESTCFTDVFGFTIRAQDVGTGIGVGLRTLIWNAMKADILTGANDGVFN